MGIQRLHSLLVAVTTVLFLSQVLSAGYVEDILDMDEASAARQFENDVPGLLKSALSDESSPCPQIKLKRTKKHSPIIQFVSEKDGEYLWEEVARCEWNVDGSFYTFRPYWGKEYSLKMSEMHPVSLAEVFEANDNDETLIVSLICWLYSKGADAKANSLLSELAGDESDDRTVIEAWICEKNNWTLPENGLLLKTVFDFDRNRHGKLLTTQKAFDSEKKVREKKAKVVFNSLKRDVGSVKGRSGQRKGSPDKRLAVLKIQLEAFIDMYGDLQVVTKKANKKKLDEMKVKVNSDLMYLEGQLAVCESLDLNGNYIRSAEAWSSLLRMDPLDTALLAKAAHAHLIASEKTRGRDIVNQKHAGIAKEKYGELMELHPSRLEYRTYAARTNLMLGDKYRAVAIGHYRFVIDKVEELKSPTPEDIQNKITAENELKRLVVCQKS